MEPSPIAEFCIKCVKNGGTVTCSGCRQYFCRKHLNEHEAELSRQMDDVVHDYDLLRQALNEENRKHPLVSYINDWEKRSIHKIQLAAEEARKEIQKYLDQNLIQLKASISPLVEDLKACYKSENYTEIEINKFMRQLDQLRDTFEKPPTIEIIDNDQMLPTIYLIKRQEDQTMVQTLTPSEVVPKSSKYCILLNFYFELRNCDH